MTPFWRKSARMAFSILSAVSFTLFLSFFGGGLYHALNHQVRVPRGMAALKSGNYEQAVKDFEYLSKRDPESSHWRNLLRVAYVKRGEQLINALPPDDQRRMHERLMADPASVISKSKTVPGDKPAAVASPAKKANP